MDSLSPLGLGHAVEEAEVVQIFGRGVAAVQSRLVGNHPETAARTVEVFGETQTVELDRAGVGAQDAAQAAQGRGLAGSVLPEQYEQLALLHLQVHAVDRDDISKALAKAVDPDHWLDGRDGAVGFRSFRRNRPGRRRLSPRLPAPRPGRA